VTGVFSSGVSHNNDEFYSSTAVSVNRQTLYYRVNDLVFMAIIALFSALTKIASNCYVYLMDQFSELEQCIINVVTFM
jgi:hypothetical protein